MSIADEQRPNPDEWDTIRRLAAQAKAGVLSLSDAEREVVLRVAQELALTVTADLSDAEYAARFLKDCGERIAGGSRKLGKAIVAAEDLYENGQTAEAEAVLSQFIENEP